MSILLSGRRRRAGKIRFRPCPLQPCSDEWLALDGQLEPAHLVRTIARAVNRLDFGPLWDLYAGFGSPAYPPQLLLAAVLFETQRGHHCPAHWHRDAIECGPVRWLLRGFVPSRACWYRFRDRLSPQVLALAQQAVRQAIAEGFTTATSAAIDGTLLAANASRHELVDETVLTQRREHLRQAIAADEPAAAVPTAPRPQAASGAAAVRRPPAATQDTAAPQYTVATASPRWLAPTVRGRRRRAKRYEKAKDEMARRQSRNRQKRASKRTRADRIVIAPGDPAAALGRDKEKVFRPLYDVQLLDDLDSPLILGWLVAAQPNDAGLLGPMLRQVKEGLGVTIEAMVADAGYAGGADLAEADGLGTTAYAPWQTNDFSQKKASRYYKKEQFEWMPQEQAYECPQGQRLSLRKSSGQKRSGTEKVELQMYQAEPATCASCPARGKCTPGKGARTISRSEHEGHIEALRQRMKAEEAKQLYKRRKQTVELANADMKGHRALRRLSGRGLSRASAQVGLTVLAHDLVALDQLRRKREQGATPTTPCPPGF
ncbi:MAG: IS1182 family transposase [Vicinamibacterales bacterium]